MQKLLLYWAVIMLSITARLRLSTFDTVYGGDTELLSCTNYFTITFYFCLKETDEEPRESKILEMARFLEIKK